MQRQLGSVWRQRTALSSSDEVTIAAPHSTEEAELRAQAAEQAKREALDAEEEAKRAGGEATRAIASAKEATELLIQAATARVMSRPEIIVSVSGAAAENMAGLAGRYTRTTIELTSGLLKNTSTTGTATAWRLIGAPFEWQGESFDDVHIALKSYGKEDGCFVIGSLQKWNENNGKVEWGWIVVDGAASDSFLALDDGEETRSWKFCKSDATLGAKPPAATPAFCFGTPTSGFGAGVAPVSPPASSLGAAIFSFGAAAPSARSGSGWNAGCSE